jgi:hypothetical protein
MIRQVTNARQSHLPFGLDLLRAFFEANFTIDDVRFSSSSGLSSDITPLSKSANKRRSRFSSSGGPPLGHVLASAQAATRARTSYLSSAASTAGRNGFNPARSNEDRIPASSARTSSSTPCNALARKRPRLAKRSDQGSGSARV